MTIDPRLQERRQSVAEDRAVRNVGRLLRFLIAFLVIAGTVWLLYSPWLSVAIVETEGVSQSETHRTLVALDVVAGRPMFQVDANEIERELETDPWVAEATVEKQWPDTVTITIVERIPIAWTLTGDGWTRRAIDGVAIPSADQPDPGMVHIDLGSEGGDDLATSNWLIGSLTFAEVLEPSLHAGTVVRIHEGELWATVSGFQVRLGRPVDMDQKALALAALLQEDLAPESVLVLIAPTNPSVLAPTVVTDDEPAGGEDDE